MCYYYEQGSQSIIKDIISSYSSIKLNAQFGCVN